MALSSTERNRRRRKHLAGDHSLCDPARCDDAVASATTTRTSETRGERLIRDLLDGLGPEHVVLLEEAGRIADRLDRLDAILRNERREWMHFRTRDDGDVRVIVTGVLSEAREQATALRGLIVEIARAKTAKPGAPAGEGKPRGLLAFADELAPRRKAPSA